MPEAAGVKCTIGLDGVKTTKIPFPYGSTSLCNLYLYQRSLGC